MSGEWWEGLAPAQVPIECSGATHRLRWEAGSLRALDHADPEGERALAALGGERCACVDVLGMWAHHEHDPRVLVVASRGAGDQLHAYSSGSAHGGAVHGVRFAGPTRPVAVNRRVITGYAQPMVGRPIGPVGGRTGFGMPEPDELVTLLTLGGGLGDRLTATVVAHWAERLAREDGDAVEARPALLAALYGRVLCTLRDWLGEPQLDLDLEMVPADGTPSITRSENRVRASLPFDWLRRVWVPALALVFGRLTLAAERRDEKLALLTVGPSLTDLRPVTIAMGESQGG